jgi:hypothetical protein
VLQHRFVELHMEDVEHTPPRYEARVFIGPDTVPGRLVGHWLDNFGAAFSVPPATGAAVGDSLTLDFPYRDGAFHDTFVYDPGTDTWTIRLDAADGTGRWKRFADYRAVLRPRLTRLTLLPHPGRSEIACHVDHQIADHRTVGLIGIPHRD